MHEHFSDSDDAFLAGFESCTLPPSAFNHLGHLRIAWINLQRLPLEDAVRETCAGIRRFASHLGAADKYHHTLSEALVRLMAARGAGESGWDAFLAGNEDLRRDAPGVLARHYSPACLASGLARQQFVPPDREALPQ